MRNNEFRRKRLNSKGDAVSERRRARGIRSATISVQESILKQEFWLWFNQAAGVVITPLLVLHALNINKSSILPFCKMAIWRWKDAEKEEIDAIYFKCEAVYQTFLFLRPTYSRNGQK